MVLLSAIASFAPAMKSSAAGTSRIEIVSRECSMRMTPTLTASGSANAAESGTASAAAKSGRTYPAKNVRAEIGNPFAIEDKDLTG